MEGGGGGGQPLEETVLRLTAEVAALRAQLEGAVGGGGRVAQLEARVGALEAAVQRALQHFLPRVDALLARQEEEEEEEEEEGGTARKANAGMLSAATRAGAAAGDEEGGDGELSLAERFPTAAALHEAAQRGDPQAQWLRGLLGAQLHDSRLYAALVASQVRTPSEERVWAGTGEAEGEGAGAGGGGRGRLPLHRAAARGDAPAVLLFLEGGAAVDPKDADGATPLALAASGGHEEAAALLLERRANPDAPDLQRETPLLRAARRGHWAIVRALVARGAQPCRHGRTDESALVLAARAGQAEALQAMLRACLPNSGGSGGGGGRLAAFLARRPRSQPATPPALATEVGRALEEAGSAGAVRALAHAAPDVVRGPKGAEALRRAAWDGRRDALDALLDAGVPVNGQDAWGWAPLHVASTRGHASCVTALLARGADAEARNREGARAAEVAGSAEAVWALAEGAPRALSGAAATGALRRLARDGRQEALVALLEMGVDADAANPEGWRALHYASKEGHAGCVAVLLQRGADKDAQTAFGYTPLHFAAWNGRADCVRALRQAGARHAPRSRSGKTPLDLAPSEEVRALLAHEPS